MNCPKCFCEIKPNQRFCQNCGCEISMPKIDEMKTMAADEFDQPPEQPEGYQYQPAEQPAGMQYQETQQPEGYQYQPPEQPASNPHDFSQQFQQYQQGSGIHGTRSGDGSLPPEKKKTTMIVLISVIAALIIGGAVVAAILIFGNKDGDSDRNSSPESSQTSIIDSTSGSKAESSDAFGFGSSSDVSQSSSWYDYSSSEVSERSSQPSLSGDSHTITNSKGVEIANDYSIDTTDSGAESKITALQNIQGAEDSTNSLTTIKFYAVGNAYVQEEQLLEKSSETEKEAYKTVMDGQLADVNSTLTNMRSASGVSNMVYVYVLLDSDDEIIYQKIAK